MATSDIAALPTEKTSPLINDWLPIQDNAGASDAEQIQVQNLLGKAYQQITSADVTDQTTYFEFQAVKGKLYGIDMASIDADSAELSDNENLRILFPNSPSEGDTFGYFIESESDKVGIFAQTPGYCVEVEGGATHKIRGETVTPLDDGGSKWSSWMAGERWVFRYINATIGWIPVEHYRIRHTGRVTFAANTTLNPWTNGVFVEPAFDLVRFDTANCWDSTAFKFDIKREGNYDINAAMRSVDQGSTGRLALRIRLTAGVLAYYDTSIGAAENLGRPIATSESVPVGAAELYMDCIQTTGADVDFAARQTSLGFSEL